MKLATELRKLATGSLRKAMNRASKNEYKSLSELKSAIATAEAGGVVDATVIQEAKVLLATQPLCAAMRRRDLAELKAAIKVAEGEAEADAAIIEVRGAYHRNQTLYI